jgi:hypothetical protein
MKSEISRLNSMSRERLVIQYVSFFFEILETVQMGEGGKKFLFSAAHNSQSLFSVALMIIWKMALRLIRQKVIYICICTHGGSRV